MTRVFWGATAKYAADPVLGVVAGQRRRQFVSLIQQWAATLAQH